MGLLERFAAQNPDLDVRKILLRSGFLERERTFREGQARLSEARRSLKARRSSSSQCGSNCSEVLRLIRVEVEAFGKRFEDQLYCDLEEAIPAHIKRELRRNGGVN